MSEIEQDTPESPSGSSRRAALKAGVGVGVGLIAWSGPTITSLGGTPAYAAGCTFIVRVNLSGGCRNTDQQSGCLFGYHTIDTSTLPAGYAISPIIPEGTCCTASFDSTLTFPAGITCTVVIRFHGPPQCSPESFITALVYGPESDGSLVVSFDCPPVNPFPSNGQYTINLTCATTGAPPGCLT